MVAVLEDMSDPPMQAVEDSAVAAVEALHRARERDIRRFNQQVDVVGHQDVGNDAEPVAMLIVGQIRQIALKVTFREKDFLAAVAAADDVVEGAGDVEAGLARHGRAYSTDESQITSLTPGRVPRKEGYLNLSPFLSPDPIYSCNISVN